MPEFDVRSLSNGDEKVSSTTIATNPTTTKTTTTETSQQQHQQEKGPSSSFLRSNNNKEPSGFHSIHVYHGPDNAIDSLPNNSNGLVVYQNYNKGSQVDQDRVVAALALALSPPQQEQEPFYFVDLAANDAIQLSNTLLLEQQKGWHGLCVEPNPIYWFRLAHRKCDVAAAFVGGKHDAQQVQVSLANKEFGGIVGDNMDNTKETREAATEQRYAISLKSLFDDFGVPKSIDYLSLDVEGAEELIMRDFPFQDYQIHFLTLERPKPELQTILRSNGYQFVMMLVFWGETLWVHESVVHKMGTAGMDKIQEIVKANSDHVQKKPQRGQMVFNIETGEYKRVF